MEVSGKPLNRLLISVTKKYLTAFSQLNPVADLDRYLYVLVLIDDHQEQLSQKALADSLQVDKSYMVGIIDHLTEKGYVFREKNEKDKREQLIRLTDKAKDAVPEVRRVIGELNQRLLEGLNEEQIGTFLHVLNQIDENLVDIKPYNIVINYKK